jgi:single-strand DNA-binding protein
MNIIQIAGHLGADPETRFTANNLKVTTFRVATNIRRKEKDETIWWRVTVWGDRFDKMMTYLKKGSAAIVVGELKPEIFMDKEGKPQLSLDITADMIKFSPFGKPDRPEQQSGFAQGSSPQGGTSYAGGTQPYATPAPAQNFGRTPYSSGTSRGQNSGSQKDYDEEQDDRSHKHHETEEEPLPF